MLTLYHFETSPYCWKVRITLAEKRIQYNAIIPQNRDKDPDFQRMTPVGKVPVLVLEDGTALFESTIINEFLQERYPNPSLMPNDPADKARARMVESLGDEYLGPALRLIFLSRYKYEAGKVRPLRTIDRDQEAEGLRISGRYLDYLDRELEGQEYFVTQFSLADIGMTPFLLRTARLLELPFAQKWPNLAAWIERTGARPSVASTMPPPYQVLTESV